MKKNAVLPGCTFDPRVVPASVPDSWLSLSREIDYTPPGFYLRTCHSVRDGSTFGIELLDAKGSVVNTHPSSSPALTVLQGNGARLECAFGSGDALQPWMTVVLGDRLPAARQKACVKAIARFRCVAGLATETLESPLHERDGYWRGPVWAPYTLLACDGLRRMGQSKMASQIAADFVGTCRVAGFAENYAADNGAPLRDRAYSWTASAYFVLTQHKHGGTR